MIFWYQEKTRPNNLENLAKVFKKLTELGLTLKTLKYKFLQPSIEYVGFILNKYGIKSNPEKIKAVVDAPEPSNINELQSFLGAVNYYGKFIKHVIYYVSIIPVAQERCTLEVGRDRKR